MLRKLQAIDAEKKSDRSADWGLARLKLSPPPWTIAAKSAYASRTISYPD